MNKKVWAVLLLLLSLLFGSGCASATKGMTPEQIVKYREQKAYESEVRRLEERDKIRQFIVSCKAASMVLFYSGHNTGSRRMERRGEIYIPRHARLNDYQCSTASDAREALRRAGMDY